MERRTDRKEEIFASCEYPKSKRPRESYDVIEKGVPRALGLRLFIARRFLWVNEHLK